MKNYLEIKSFGEIDIQAFTLIGASIKRGNSAMIGMYGSGNKYSIATLLNQNIDFKVFSGEDEIKFTTKEQKIIWQIYRELYKASTPSADFDELVNSAEKNKLGQKIIPFNDYEISLEDYQEIIESNLKGQRLTKLKKQAIRNSCALGVSPRFKKE